MTRPTQFVNTFLYSGEWISILDSLGVQHPVIDAHSPFSCLLGHKQYGSSPWGYTLTYQPTFQQFFNLPNLLLQLLHRERVSVLVYWTMITRINGMIHSALRR